VTFSGSSCLIPRSRSLNPAVVQYFEAHGTATLLGDAIEVRAAAEAYIDANANLTGAGTIRLGTVKVCMHARTHNLK